MEFTFEQVGTIGIFSLRGALTGDNEDHLKIILMRAIHSIDRAVLNFKRVTQIDLKCLQLIKQAYFTSVRLKNPLILIDVPQIYLSDMVENKIDKELIADEITVDAEKVGCK
jgi:anti-anti-sigma regulatory factor